MTGSFEKIDYRLRPAKHAERLMLIELCRRQRFDHVDQYQYIGMGSVGFIDHKLFHKGLGINHMVSFEATESDAVQERFNRNIPLACIDMRFGYSSEVLPDLDYERRAIVWLDYDDKLSGSMAADIGILGSRVKSGSLIFVTFSCGMPPEGTGSARELQRLRDQFPHLVGEAAKASDFEGANYANLGRRVLGEALERSLLEHDAALDPNLRRRCSQVCYFRYRDGAAMCTVGWVVFSENENQMHQQCAFDQLPYFKSGSESFVIKIPKFTPFEISCLERLVPIAEGLPDLPWLNEVDRSDFRLIYRYLPNFGLFEPI